MTKLLKIIGISAVVLAGASAARAQISVRIGEPPPPRVYRVPPQPAPEYIWVEGYWYPQGRRYAWHDGYWTRPPYQGAYWIAPYNVGGQYYSGRWEGGRGIVMHNHHWDRDERRDERREPRRERRDERRDERR